MKIKVLHTICATVFLAATTSAMAQDADWNKVVEAAKKEGTVTVYHAQLGAAHWKAVVKSFTDKYGIEVKEFDGRASELTERVRTEQTSGRYIGDVEFHGYTSILDQMKTNFIAEIGTLPNMKNLRDDIPVIPGHSAPAWVQTTCALVNTNMVKPDDEPKTWLDFLNPKWKGKIMSDEMRAVGSGHTFTAVVGWKYGADFMQKIKDQDLLFDRDLQQMSRRIARGERPILLQQIIAFASALKGLPVKVIVPEEGCPGTPIEAALLRNAPHPNAARLFANHFLEMDSQLIYGNAWMGTVVKGVAERLTDPDAKRYAGVKVMGHITPETREWAFKTAEQIFK